MATAAASDFAETLRTSGRHVSRTRLRLMDAMADLGDHFSAEDLGRTVPDIGRATVFRTLRLLVDLGLVCQIRLADGMPGYRLGVPEHHHHLICTGCGVIRDIALPEMDGLFRQASIETGFQVVSHSVEAYGLCSRCVEDHAVAANVQGEGVSPGGSL